MKMKNVSEICDLSGGGGSSSSRERKIARGNRECFAGV
jgi:hypothetical protein